MQEVDPISGNEVPAGAMPKEVRDDVDAKLSEGEYVIPANVVRYFGVKFFENLLEKANKNLQDMKAGGRIQGGDELPFSDDELEFEEAEDEDVPVEMAEGGYVAPSFNTNTLPTYNPQTLSGVPVVEMKEFKDAEGNITNVMFIDGEPVTSIPENATEVPKEQKATPRTEGLRVKARETESADGTKQNYEDTSKWSRDASEWSNEDLNQFSQGINTHINVSKGIQAGLRLTSPIGGLVGKAMDVGTKERIESALEEIDKRVAAGTMTVEEATVNRKSLQGALEKSFTAKKTSILDKVFGNREATPEEMQRVAPKGMNYSDDTKSYTREGSAAPTSSPRPQAKPANLGGTSSSSSTSRSSGNVKNDWSKSADDPVNSGGGTKFAKGGLVQRRTKKKC